MKVMKRKKLWLGLAALALGVIAKPVHAASSANLDITVSISASKSLSVGATFYNFASQSVNTSAVSGSAIAVTNNSGALVETYTLQGANAPSTEGGTTWTLSSTPAQDTYALAGQFSTAAPSNLDASWASDDLTTSAIVCTSTVLGNGTAGESGASVAPSAARNLWFRIKTPTSLTEGGNHKATLTLAVQ